MKLILLYREFDLIPYSSTRFFNFRLVSPIIEVLIAFVYSHFSSIQGVNARGINRYIRVEKNKKKKSNSTCAVLLLALLIFRC